MMILCMDFESIQHRIAGERQLKASGFMVDTQHTDHILWVAAPDGTDLIALRRDVPGLTDHWFAHSQTAEHYNWRAS